MKKISAYTSLPFFVAALTVAGSANAWYAGGSYGQTLYEDLCDSVSAEAGATCDDDPYGYKIFAGAKLSPNVALEAAYMDFGEATASSSVSNRTLSVEGFNFSVLGIKPLSKSFEVFIKGGLLFWEGETVKTGTVNSTISVNDSDINFGFGANFNVNEKLALRAEFERFHNLSYESSAETPVSYLSLGVVINF
jgi:OOP family OmpA-OmpF porin